MASRRRATVHSLLFVVFGGPALVLAVIPWLLTRFRVQAGTPGWQIIAAVLLIVAGLVPLLESAVRFVVIGRGALVPTTPTQQLVVSGFYRCVRNPMYLGVLTAIAGEAVLFHSRGVMAEWVVVALSFEAFVRLYEERKLRHTFGDAYTEYCRRVPRWMPKVPTKRSVL